jgi:hypothetical protein
VKDEVQSAKLQKLLDELVVEIAKLVHKEHG